MTLDYGNFAKASTLIHLSQGLALLALGAAEAYLADNSDRRAAIAGPLALLAAALAGPLIIFLLPGGGSLGQARLALEVRRGFHLFIAFACLFGAAGLSRLTRVATGREAGGWEGAFLAFLALAGALYFLMASRVNEEAWRQVLVLHAAIGATLLAAVALKTAHLFSGRRILHVCWAVLLMVTGMQLLTYRESAGAFGMKLVTLQASPRIPAVKAGPAKPAAKKNAGTADKERPHD